MCKKARALVSRGYITLQRVGSGQNTTPLFSPRREEGKGLTPYPRVAIGVTVRHGGGASVEAALGL